MCQNKFKRLNGPKNVAPNWIGADHYKIILDNLNASNNFF